MRKDVVSNQTRILKAISELHRGGKPINISQIAKESSLTWKTVKRYFNNDFYLKGA